MQPVSLALPRCLGVCDKGSVGGSGGGGSGGVTRATHAAAGAAAAAAGYVRGQEGALLPAESVAIARSDAAAPAPAPAGPTATAACTALPTVCQPAASGTPTTPAAPGTGRPLPQEPCPDAGSSTHTRTSADADVIGDVVGDVIGDRPSGPATRRTPLAVQAPHSLQAAMLRLMVRRCCCSCQGCGSGVRVRGAGQGCGSGVPNTAWCAQHCTVVLCRRVPLDYR